MVKEYYAVAIGHNIGIFDNLEDFNNSLNGYPGSKGAKFNNLKDAENFLNTEFFVVVNNNTQRIFDSEKQARKWITKKNKKIWYAKDGKTAIEILKREKNKLWNDKFKTHKSNNKKKNIATKNNEKYYAVRKGFKPGIYFNSNDFKKQLNGFVNAEGKAFNSLAEANSYLNKPIVINKDNIYNNIYNNDIYKNHDEWYVVIRGYEPGIYNNVNDFNKNINQFPKAYGKKFNSIKEAINFFLDNNKPNYYIVIKGHKPGLYFKSSEFNEQLENYSKPIGKKITNLQDIYKYIEEHNANHLLEDINNKIDNYYKSIIKNDLSSFKTIDSNYKKNINSNNKNMQILDINTNKDINKSINKDILVSNNNYIKTNNIVKQNNNTIYVKQDDLLNSNTKIMLDSGEIKTVKEIFNIINEKNIEDEKENDLYYAIIKGRSSYVTNSKLEAINATIGYNNGLFLGFKSEEEANNYLNGFKYFNQYNENNQKAEFQPYFEDRLDRVLLSVCITDEDKKFMDNIKSINCNTDTVKAYTDGSYSSDHNCIGIGLVYKTENLKIIHSSFLNIDDVSKYFEYSSSLAEIRAAIIAIETAILQGKKNIEIFHDYMLLDSNELLAVKKPGKLLYAYKQYLESVMPLINIKFNKIKAHSGHQYNEVADTIAHIKNIN